MGLAYRYITALWRHHRSRGFGIHSPFAFGFVTEVLREKCPYYAYADIEALRDEVRVAARHEHPRRQVIGLHKALMLFRITNYFNPSHILLLGTAHGLTASAMLRVSSRSQLYVCGQLGITAQQVLKPYGSRVHRFGTPAEAFEAYNHNLAEGDRPFVLVNEIAGADDLGTAEATLMAILDAGGVVTLRHLRTSKSMRQLWTACKLHMTEGQTFSNDKEAILVPGQRPLEHFSLWF